MKSTLLALFLVGCGGTVAGTYSTAQLQADGGGASCAQPTHDGGALGAMAADADDPVEDHACALLSRYYSALQAAKCVHVITIVSGETCEETLVRLEGCLNNATCKHGMEVGCPAGLPLLQ